MYKFIQLFMTCFDVGTEILISALIYIDRLLSMNNDSTTGQNSNFVLTDVNAKSLLLAALTLASKFYLDKFEKNTIFYASGGLTKRKMRNLLDTYLDLIDYKLVIQEEEFNGLMSTIKTMIAHKYAQVGQIVILEKNLRKRGQPSTSSIGVKGP